MVTFNSRGSVFRNTGKGISAGNFHLPVPPTKPFNADASERVPGVNNKIRTIDFVGEQERKVLIVEDEPMNALFLMEVIGELTGNDSRVDVVHVGCGEEAVEKCGEEDYALVLMDIRLPAMNGLEATRAIKRAKPEQPVVMETAYAFPDDRQRAFDAGCDDYLAKPIAVEHLQKILNQYILP